MTGIEIKILVSENVHLHKENVHLHKLSRDESAERVIIDVVGPGQGKCAAHDRAAVRGSRASPWPRPNRNVR